MSDEIPINFRGTCMLEDLQARKCLQQLEIKIDSINDRTKAHTIQIKEIEKKIKEIELRLSKVLQ